MNRNTKLLFAHKFLYDIYFYGALTVPFFVYKDYGISAAMIFASLYMFISMATEIPTGLVGDRYGHRVSIMMGAFMTGVGMIGLLFSKSIVLDFLMIFILGTGSSLVSGSDVALLRNISNRFERDNRLFHYLKSTMLLLSFGLAGFMVSVYGMSVTIGLTGVLALVCTTPLFFIRDGWMKDGHFSSFIEHLKAFPAAFRSVSSGKSIVILGGLAGAVTFSAKELISSLHNVYSIDLELVGIIAAAAMAGRIIGTFLEKYLRIDYKWLFTTLVVVFSLASLIELNRVIGITVILLSIMVAQIAYYRLQYRLSLVAPKQHLATILSSLSLAGGLLSAGIIFVVGLFTGQGIFYVSFAALGILFAVAAIMLLPNVLTFKKKET